MKRSISTLLTVVLFAAAPVPNAMAQTQNYNGSAGSLMPSAATTQQPAPAATTPIAPTTDVAPAPLNRPASGVSTIDTAKSLPGLDRSNANNSYPAYCPALPPGTQPGDWDYREALHLCLYGS